MVLFKELLVLLPFDTKIQCLVNQGTGPILRHAVETSINWPSVKQAVNKVGVMGDKCCYTTEYSSSTWRL